MNKVRKFDNVNEDMARIEYATSFELEIVRKNTQDFKMRLNS